MGLSFTIAASPRQRIVGSKSRRSNDHILLSQTRDSPNLEGHVPVFISPRNRAAQLYPQAVGSRFFASYDSQGYVGGIRTRLHTGSLFTTRLVSSLYKLGADNTSIVVGVFTDPLLRNGLRACMLPALPSNDRCLHSHCLATGLYATILSYLQIKYNLK
jgi:hypothetical protein